MTENLFQKQVNWIDRRERAAAHSECSSTVAVAHLSNARDSAAALLHTHSCMYYLHSGPFSHCRCSLNTLRAFTSFAITRSFILYHILFLLSHSFNSSVSYLNWCDSLLPFLQTANSHLMVNKFIIFMNWEVTERTKF